MAAARPSEIGFYPELVELVHQVKAVHSYRGSHSPVAAAPSRYHRKVELRPNPSIQSGRAANRRATHVQCGRPAADFRR